MPHVDDMPVNDEPHVAFGQALPQCVPDTELLVEHVHLPQGRVLQVQSGSSSAWAVSARANPARRSRQMR